MGRYLRALEMGVEEKDPNVIRVEPPSFRVDITREVDLVEEVARLDGFDNIPVSYPSIRPSEQGEPPERVLRDRMRQIMVGMGFAETITYSFISPDSADMLGAAQKSALRSFVRLLNPLSREQSVMRTSLIPGLMATARTNILNEERELKLFEWGKVFIRIEGDEQPAEKLCLGGLITGPYRQKPWYEDERRVDFYDIKGEVEALLKAVGIRDLVFQVEGDVPGFDPELCAGIHRAEVLLGHAGRVSPDTMRAYDLEDEEAWIFELDIDALLTILPKELKFEPFAKFPAVYRDISLIVDRHTESAGILKIAKSVGGDLVESVRIFDLYEGEKMDPSEKALAFRICYRSREGTLDGVEVNRLHGAIIDRIRQETGGRLREG
jgi:phenylalanyl-tRNA synthetase beta chain